MIVTDVLHELQLSAGLPLFARVVFLGWRACVLPFSRAYYVYKTYKGHSLTTNSFFRDALIKFDWPVWGSITTVLFLIANHLFLPVLAVGIWDVDGQFYPFQVIAYHDPTLRADHNLFADVVAPSLQIEEKGISVRGHLTHCDEKLLLIGSLRKGSII